MIESNDGPAALDKVQELFMEALTRDLDKRDAYLNKACAGDYLLVEEVRSLLEADKKANVLGPLAPRVFGKAGTTIQSGHQVGPYKILERVGSGGMGVVFKAFDTRLERFVVLKFLSGSSSTDGIALKRFILEARAASALDHPNICVVHDIGNTEDDDFYIAMAYCEGESLAKKLAYGPLTGREALEIAIQLAQGLAAAHLKDIIHRDIKPANVIVGPDGRAKIVDFGIAKMRGINLTSTGFQVGTAAYMAPEQFSNAVIDQRTDIWALGVLLFEMLTGQKPFWGKTDVALMNAVLKDQPPPLSDYLRSFPLIVEQTIKRALARRPENRYDTMEDVILDLDVAREQLNSIPVIYREGISREQHGFLSGDDDTRQTVESTSVISKQWLGRAKRSMGRSRNVSFTVLFAVVLALSVGAIWKTINYLDPTIEQDVNPVSKLVQSDANGNSVKEPNSDALLLASHSGSAETVSQMVAAGADPNTKDAEGWSALTHASWRGHEAVVRTLLLAGADPNTGETKPLIAAVVNGHKGIVRLLLTSGANPNSRDADGVPALILAVASEKPGRMVTVGDLLDLGADPSLSVSGVTALDLAVQNGDEQLTQLLRRGLEDSEVNKND